MKILVSMFSNKIVKMFSLVVNITQHSHCIEMQKAALLMYAIYPFKSTNLHITVCGILIERVC